ncbi:MAG TPA: 3'-5' exonuclease, partial [Armatimonadota bacterium]|nr:3'-5' exonuclease [Armatimonadota bacterium]
EVSRLLLDMPQETLRGALLATYSTGRTHGYATATMTPVPDADAADAAAAVQQAMAALLACPGTSAWMQALARARKTFETEVLPLLAPPWEPERFWDHYYRAEALSKSLTPAGGPTGGVAKALREAVKGAYGRWLGARLDGVARPYLLAMAYLIGRFDAAYRAAKDAEGLLDFEDLLLRARVLLLDEESGVARRCRGRFAHVMVDEFQDTNPLQFSIISAVCGESGGLFAVGDVKQSIYRFIGSDVRVFLDYEARLAGDGEARLALRTNYRARPDVLQPINGLFAALWPVFPERRDDEFTFQPLRSPDTTAPDKAIPSLEIAFWTASGEGADTLRTREADWIARRILQVTGRYGEPALRVEDADTHDGRDAHAGDILVLFRSSAEIPLYAGRLRAAGVPVYVVSGRGFYQAREVQDIIHLLRAVENPLDDFSLTVVLRSPLVAVSDDALYWLSHAAPFFADEEETEDGELRPALPRACGRLWEAIERLERIPRLAARDRERLLAFRAFLGELQAMAPAGQPLDLLDLILDRTGYAICLLAGDDGEQRCANLRKLREVAAAFQKSGLFDLADFRRHLAHLQDVAPREASAPLDAEKSRTVRLMTIHAAKGLEAPVVFLADGGWGKATAHRQRERVIYQPGVGIACQVPTPEDEMCDPAGYLTMRDTLDAEDAREAERLLYVAMTRAREHLICSGFTKKNVMPPTYLGLLTAMLEKAGVTADGDIRALTVDGVAYPVRVWTEEAMNALAALPAAYAPAASVWEACAAQLHAGLALPIPAGPDDFPSVIARFAPLRPARRDLPLRIGVNRALDYAACPRQYWFRYLLHRAHATRGALPPVLEAEDEGDDDERERTDGTEFGTLLHAVLQRAAFDAPLAGQLPSLLPMLGAARARAITPAEEHSLHRCLSRLSALEMYHRLTRASECHREQRFLAREGDVLYTGIIDVLARDEDGWWILDYKTGRSSPRHLRQVGLYALGIGAAMRIAVADVAVIYLDEDTPARAVNQRRVTDEFTAALRTLLRGVGEGIRHGAFAPSPGRQCEFCPFRTECPAGRAVVMAVEV